MLGNLGLSGWRSHGDCLVKLLQKAGSGFPSDLDRTSRNVSIPAAHLRHPRSKGKRQFASLDPPPLSLRVGTDWGGRQVSPGQPGGASLAPRVPRTPCPCPAGPCSFAAARVSRPPSLPLPLPLPRRLTRTLCLFSCLHLGPADIVITPMHAGSARLPRAPAHSLTHNVPSRQASDF